MTAGRIVLDTNVLWSPEALQRLAGREEPAVLPAVAFTERARQYRRRGASVAALWRQLEANGILVEDFGPEHGLRFAAQIMDDKTWTEVARDALIAGHVGPGDVLWTRNRRDFLRAGVPEGQIEAV